ncbi:hypothetical protein FO478_12955 [Heyndrickxia coagulans DSM 1 = ATCC 7050]|nr:hypothetical protein [Heyndrickxia coagulans DSM 1 = ATCC 7050]
MGTLRGELKKWGKQNQNKENKPRGRPRKTKSERLSQHDIKTLMGYYDPVYKRGRGGAWRNGR